MRRLRRSWAAYEADERAPQTIEIYRDIVRRIILLAVGELRLSELTVGILDRFLKVEAARAISRGRAARVVPAQIIDLAVRHDALPRDPVRLSVLRMHLLEHERAPPDGPVPPSPRRISISTAGWTVTGAR